MRLLNSAASSSVSPSCCLNDTILSFHFSFDPFFFSYDGRNVPDTMNVHGIYETSAFMLTFENSAEYQTYLQHQAGVSGSIFGFSAGVKKAWGGSMQTSTQQYMAALYVDVER